MYSLFGIIVLILDIYALYQIITSAVPTLHKVLWALLVLILPVIGLVIWFIAGPRGGSARI